MLFAALIALVFVNMIQQSPISATRPQWGAIAITARHGVVRMRLMRAMVSKKMKTVLPSMDRNRF